MSLTAAEMTERKLHRRAVEAALWGMPLVSFDAIRQAYFHDASATYNDIIYWSKPASWRNQLTTPNTSAHYVMFFLNVKDGPVIVDIPAATGAALFGSLIDAWGCALVDVGQTGDDQGHGGRYLVLPPDTQAQPTTGFVPVRSATYNVHGLLRVIPKTRSAQDVAAALELVRRLQIHPLSTARPTRTPKLVDMADKPFDALPRYDASFYRSLARMVSEEPTKLQDLAMMSQLHSLGIGDGTPYRPSALVTEIMQRAIAEAHDYMVEGFRTDGVRWWPHRRWQFLVADDIIKSKATFRLGARILVDERAFMFFGAFGPTKSPSPHLYVKTFEDSSGQPLDGSHTYRLQVPPNVPTTQFWSVSAYDNRTAGPIREAPVVGVDSYMPDVRRNADGSVDLYIAPQPPKGQEANWISSASGKPFFLVFRNYGPDRAVFTRTSTWVLGDVERVK